MISAVLKIKSTKSMICLETKKKPKKGFIMENIETITVQNLAEKTAIHPRLLSAVPIDMLELINQLDTEHEQSCKEQNNVQR